MIEALLARYGLLAVFVGAGVEGEAVAMGGGLLAHRGYVTLPAAMLAATLGSFLVDQLWYFAGKQFGERPFVQRFAGRPAFARALRTLARHPIGFILLFRFIYGMRTVTPIAIGMSAIPLRKFMPLNLLAAAIWAPLFTYLGYRFGERAIAVVRHILPLGFGVLAVAVALIGLAVVFARSSGD